MAPKIHPSTSLQSSSASSSSSCHCCSSSAYITSKIETFTVWMKSLVMQANGCTVYNSDGEIVYRVDNYEKKGSNDVYLMDLKGNVIFTILKEQWPFGQWKGYRCDGFESKNQKPFFQATKRRVDFLSGDSCCRVMPGSKSKTGYYKFEASAGKIPFKITNSNGSLVAKAERKQSSSGVVLGEDVLTLVVQPDVDHSFIMALVTVYGLMRQKL
ncbi:hypothetical protein K2173_021693 [Erythroxylum novogranatense]|uniref:Uncharacterized protein n=1 Tax=Erythroxylum novogranatense TaxID=1862640 RepID=A0AAV8TH77_9ROSI|nr:hypothetical protein K2173_021693 [Erythroxylum novogranatense]